MPIIPMLILAIIILRRRLWKKEEKRKMRCEGKYVKEKEEESEKNHNFHV